MYSVIEIHSHDSGMAIFAGRKQGPCMTWRRGRPPTSRSHATLTVVSAMRLGTRRNVRSCPHCRRLCSPTLGGGRRGRPGKCGRVILSPLVIGRLLLAAVIRRLLVTSKGNDAYHLHARRTAVHTVAATMQHRRGYFQSLNKIRIVADELRMFKKRI